jgi:hypothetical protein
MSEFPLQALARVPGLVIRLFFTVLRMKRKAKKSARKLRKAMIKGGMDRKRAKELASKYEEGLSFRKLMKGVMGGTGSSFPFSFDF